MPETLRMTPQKKTPASEGTQEQFHNLNGYINAQHRSTQESACPFLGKGVKESDTHRSLSKQLPTLLEIGLCIYFRSGVAHIMKMFGVDIKNSNPDKFHLKTYNSFEITLFKTTSTD